MNKRVLLLGIRVLVPLFIIGGFTLWHIFDDSNGASIRWPGVSLWIMGGVLILVYNLLPATRPVSGSPVVHNTDRKLLHRVLLVLLGLLLLVMFIAMQQEGLGAIPFVIYGVLPLLVILAIFVVATVYVKK